MISKVAVKEFLNRDLDDWTWMKDLRKRQVLEEIYTLAPHFKFKTEPYLHQAVCFLIGMYNPYFSFHLDLGFGKTKLTLDLINLRKQRRQKYLILAPSVVSVMSWMTEIEIHSNLDAIPVIGTEEDRRYALKEKADLYIMNCDGLKWLLCEKGKKKKGNEGGMIPIEKKIREFSKLFNGVVIDESHLKGLKNHKSLNYKLCKKISKDSAFRYGLTGTPMGRNPMDLWPQFFLVDRGETLGSTLGMFQQAFFSEKIGWHGGREYEFKSKMERVFNQMLGHRSIRYAEEELFDVPPVIRKTIETTFSVELAKYYERALQGLKEELKGGYKTLENNFMKLRQLTAGFLYFKNEDLKRTVLDFDPNPKLEVLEELLLEISERDSIIIYHEFQHSGNLIEALLKKLKISYGRLYGGSKDKTMIVEKFINKQFRVFIINSASGGTGLNLQISRYGIFYESPVSPITRRQTEGRFTGARQTLHRCAFIYDISIKGSIDGRISQLLAEGKNLFDAIINGKIDINSL